MEKNETTIVSDDKTPMVSQDEKTMAGLIHLLSLLGITLGSIIIWLVKKDESEFVDRHGKTFLNFFLSVIIYGVVTGFLCLIVVGFFLIPVLTIYALVVAIVGTVKAFKGEEYTYPLVITFLK